jgi:4-oxalomesaconate tautomerase
MLTPIPCTLMRGGTSKGLYFDAASLPAETGLRDRVLLAAMGSPDLRQIDGMGGAHPLTSKVAVISLSQRADADVDYLFLQVAVDRPEVSDSQNCGNLLAGVGPWAIEKGVVPAQDGAWSNTKVTRASTGCPAPPRRSRCSFSMSRARAADRFCPRAPSSTSSTGSR